MTGISHWVREHPWWTTLFYVMIWNSWYMIICKTKYYGIICNIWYVQLNFKHIWYPYYIILKFSIIPNFRIFQFQGSKSKALIFFYYFYIRCLFPNLYEKLFYRYNFHFEEFPIFCLYFRALLRQFLREVFALYKMVVVSLDRIAMYLDRYPTFGRSSLRDGPWFPYRSHDRKPRNSVCHGLYEMDWYGRYNIALIILTISCRLYDLALMI